MLPALLCNFVVIEQAIANKNEYSNGAKLFCNKLRCSNFSVINVNLYLPRKRLIQVTLFKAALIKSYFISMCKRTPDKCSTIFAVVCPAVRKVTSVNAFSIHCRCCKYFVALILLHEICNSCPYQVNSDKRVLTKIASPGAYLLNIALLQFQSQCGASKFLYIGLKFKQSKS